MANIFFVNDAVNIGDLLNTKLGNTYIVRIRSDNVNNCVKFIDTEVSGRTLLKESAMPKSVVDKLRRSRPGSVVLLTDDEFDKVKDIK